MATVAPDNSETAGNWAAMSFLAPAQGAEELGRLAQYRVLKKLGQGGMGMVLLGEDTMLGRKVALKVMSPTLSNSQEAKQRFFREAKAMAALKHDNIATIYQVGEERGVPFLAMEFLQGMSLEDRLAKKNRLSLPECVKIARETAEGLAAAHERGLIHRDIKPANLWLEAPKGRVKILDFGLARITGDATELTAQGAIMGTPSFMAPEQTQGLPADFRSDLFSLGVVIYLLCTDELPFKGTDLISTLYAVSQEPHKPVHLLNPKVPPAFELLIDRLMAKKPLERPTSTKEVVKDLRTIERSLLQRSESKTALMDPSPVPAAVPPPPPLPAAERSRKGGKTVALLIGILLLGGGGVAGYYYLQNMKLLDNPGQQFVQAPKETSVLQPSTSKASSSPAKATPGRGNTAIAPTSQKQPNIPPVSKKGELDSAWVRKVEQLRGEEQWREVLDELKRRNVIPRMAPRHRIEGGVLRELHMPSNQLEDIAPLALCKGLTVLTINGLRRQDPNAVGKVTDLSPLRGMKLTQFHCINNRITDLSPLRGMPLRDLDFHDNQVTSLEPVRGMPLVRLDCRNNPGLTDLSPLKDCTALEELNCDAIRPRDVRMLKNLKSLKMINSKLAADFWKEHEAGKR
jgi:serine/threonine protein kinase